MEGGKPRRMTDDGSMAEYLTADTIPQRLSSKARSYEGGGHRNAHFPRDTITHLGCRMADSDRRIPLVKQHSRRHSNDVRPADNDGPLALDWDPTALKQLNAAEGGAGDKEGLTSLRQGRDETHRIGLMHLGFRGRHGTSR